MSRATLRPCANCGDTFLRRSNTRYCSVPCRFIHKIDVRDCCWEWMATLDRHGYGTFFDGGNRPAHRVAYALWVGPIPAGLDIDHLCRNRACVNPEHLEAVSRRTNILRGAAPTALTFQMNRCKRGHQFTPENTVIKGGDPSKRQCRQCQNDGRRARYAETRRAS